MTGSGHPSTGGKRGQITALADGLRTARQIAEMVTTTPDYVLKVVRAEDGPRLRPRSAKARIVRHADGRLTLRELATLVGCSAHHVRAVAREMALPLRSERAEFEAKLRELASPDLTIKALAGAAGATYLRTYARVRALGLPCKPGRRKRLNEE